MKEYAQGQNRGNQPSRPKAQLSSIDQQHQICPELSESGGGIQMGGEDEVSPLT